jgi:adenine-specific DNA-methyltransferase
MGALSQAIRRARKLRQTPTDCEAILWRQLRYRQISGHKFRRQRPIGPYIVDFICLEKGLIIEVDGGKHGNESDIKRDTWLRSEGYRLLRFWDHEVLKQIEGVKERIFHALAGPPPVSSPEAGEEG